LYIDSLTTIWSSDA